MIDFKPSKRLELQLFKKELSLIERIENEVWDDFHFNVKNSDSLSNLLRFKIRNELYNFVRWTRWEYDQDSISQEQWEFRLEQLNECWYWFSFLENAFKWIDKMCDEIIKDIKETLEQHKEIIFPRDREKFDDALEDVYKKYEGYDTKVLNTDEIENND